MTVSTAPIHLEFALSLWAISKTKCCSVQGLSNIKYTFPFQGHPLPYLLSVEQDLLPFGDGSGLRIFEQIDEMLDGKGCFR